MSDHLPKAYSVVYSPSVETPAPPEAIQVGEPEFWGQPNMLKRLSLGIDYGTFFGIIGATDENGNKLWTGTDLDLYRLVVQNKLGTPSKHLPIREAIDWVYSSIYTTIKAMKFANLPPACGGPIEVAIITTDRCFRWVRHKNLDAAIGRHPNKDY